MSLMAKKQKKDPKSKGLINWYKGSKWWVKVLTFVALIIIVITGISIYQQWQLENRFSTLEKDVVVLFDSSDIDYRKDKYCFRESFKYGGGHLKCKIEVKVTIESEQELGRFIDTLNNQKVWESISYPPIQPGPYILRLNNLKTSLDCRADVYRGKDLVVKNIDFFCSEKSQRSFYPYRN